MRAMGMMVAILLLPLPAFGRDAPAKPDTSEQAAMIACGQSDCVLVDGKSLQKGPPPSYDKILERIEKRVGKLG